MTDTERKAMNLAYLIKECIGKYINDHSPKGKPARSLTHAGFPYTLKQFNISYNYFALLKKPYGKLSDDEKVLYHKRFKYVSEVIYPRFLESNYSPEKYAKNYFYDIVLPRMIKNIKTLFGDMFYDDTLAYSEKVDPERYKPTDYIRLNYFYEQLIYENKDLTAKGLTAQKRFNWIRTLFKLKDIEDVQSYIDVWKTNPEFYDDVLFKYKNDIYNSEWYVQKWNMGWR